MVNGFDERELTYHDYDDMLRDVANHTFNEDLSSRFSDLGIGDPSIRELLEHIRETTDRDLGISRAKSIPPAQSPSGASLGGESPASPAGEIPALPGGVTPQDQVRFLRLLILSRRDRHRLVFLATRRPVQLRVVDVLHLADVLHHVADVLHLTEVLHRGGGSGTRSRRPAHGCQRA